MISLIRRSTWPLFWCLSVQSQAVLMQFQYDQYGQNIDIPPLPKETHIETIIEPDEELSRMARQAPRHQKRVT